MIRFHHIVQQAVHAFPAKLSEVEECIIAPNGSTIRVLTSAGELSNTGVIRIDEQPEKIQQFLMNLLDNYSQDSKDGRQVAVLVIAGEKPVLPKGIMASTLIGVRFRRRFQEAPLTYELVSVSKGPTGERVTLSAVTPGHSDRVVELFQQFLQDYEPVM